MSDFTIFRITLRDLFRPGRLVVAALLIGLPALVALLLRSQSGAAVFNPAEAYNWLEKYIVWNFILVLLGIVFSTGLIAQEVERKTIVYLLTRPVPRWRILLMKHLAAVLAVLATAWAATLLLAAVCFGMGGDRHLPLLRPEQIKDAKAVVMALHNANNMPQMRLFNSLSEPTQNLISNYNEDESPSNNLTAHLIEDLNRVIMEPERRRRTQRRRPRRDGGAVQIEIEPDANTEPQGRFYDAATFQDIALSDKTKALIAAQGDRGATALLNRSLLQDMFPAEIGPPGETDVHVERDLLVMPLGALAYGTLFLLMGTVLLRPQILALLYAFGWELLVPQLPGYFQTASLAAYLRVLAPHQTLASEAQSSLLGAGDDKVIIAMAVAWITLLTFTAIALTASLIIFSFREYVPRDDA